MPAVVVIPVVAVDIVLGVAVGPDPLDFVPAQARRQFPVLHCHPWPVAAGRPEPAPVTAEVVAVLHVEEIVRHPHRHVKAELGGVDEIDILFDADDRHRRRHDDRCGDDDLPGLELPRLMFTSTPTLPAQAADTLSARATGTSTTATLLALLNFLDMT